MILAEFPVLFNYQDYKFTEEEWEIWHRNCLLDAAGWKLKRVLGDLIDCGMNVVNPVQPHAMDVREVVKEFGKDLVIWGATDLQHLIAVVLVSLCIASAPTGAAPDEKDDLGMELEALSFAISHQESGA